MLEILKLSTGRLGNRLFHYHFLRQVSKETNIAYYHNTMPESVYFEEMERKSKPFFSFKKKVKITSKDIISFTKEDFIKYVKQMTEKGKNIVIDPPVLGEVFFDYLFYSPNEFVKVKNAYTKKFNFENKDKIVIGLHFRGTDFPAWNEHAALKFPYYKDSIEYCIDFYRDSKIIFVLFTDDKKYPAYIDTVEFLRRDSKIEFHSGDLNNLPIYDFYQISQCDVLISSPSTFAIFAGCLGKPKKIIHSKKWIDYAVEKQDKFWVDLSNTTNPYYSLWKTF